MIRVESSLRKNFHLFFISIPEYGKRLKNSNKIFNSTRIRKKHPPVSDACTDKTKAELFAK